MGNKTTVPYSSARYKDILIWSYQLIYDLFKTKNEEFEDSFVENIAKTNGSEIYKGFRVNFSSYECMYDLPGLTVNQN